MKRTKFQRLAALILALTFIMGGALSVGATDATTGDSSVTDSSIADIQEQLSAISYEEYIAKYTDVPRASEEIVIDATKYDKENTTAEVKVETYDGVEALYTPGVGTTEWKVNIPATAKYSILIEYYPVEGKTASIERVFRLNGEIPFAEARYLTIAKIYANTYPNGEILLKNGESADTYLSAAAAAGITATTETRENGIYVVYTMPEYWTGDSAAFVDENLIRFFTHDIEGNELRQAMEQAPVWSVYDVKDANGFYAENFEFIFTEGENTLSLEAKNEAMAIKSIRLIPHEEFISYENYTAQYAGTAKGNDYIKIEAESTANTSSKTIYAVEDRSSAACSPTDPAHQLLNTIGGEKWQTAGQWASYKFTVKESGMYSIGARFRQNVLDGMFVSRSLYIYSDGLNEGDKGYYDGIPFEEAAALTFDYNDGWQSKLVSNNNERPLEFYFEAGVVYTLKFEVTLGTMGEIVRRVDAALDSINEDYLKILKLTGANPDEYRDYGFSRVMPDTLNDMVKQAFELDEISTELVEAAGEKSSQSATLDKISWLLKKMGRDEDEVAVNMEQLKSYIGTLGTWLGDAKTQPLQFDYITIQSADEEPPKATPGFFKALWHETKSFFWSFFRDYNHMGSLVETTDEETVEVWLAYGRDQSQVIRSLINNDFTPQTGISVNLKLVAGSTLLPSVLSGMGPDLYIGLGQGDVINYAIRGALDPIDHLEGFDEVKQNFNEAAMMVLGIEDSSGEYHVYGLPETQNFNMMFIREDILADLNIEIPKTWDDILAAIPILQANNMQIGMHTEYKIFLYQMGGELFADDGMRINLDSNVALTAFETMCNMFTMYGFPYTYDFSNRFRTGEMPIGIASYVGTYNQLKVFATEIEGCWGFYPLPGIEDENGNINNVSVSTASAIVMLSGSDPDLKDEAWEFMQWQVGDYFQKEYANEMVAIIGPSAKQATANREALKSLTWTTEEYNQVALQFNNLASIPNYPGSYIIDRYTNFAFLDAYNDNEDPVDSLLSYITTINKEITRKRSEFELETVDYVGQTLLDKRMLQATAAIDADIEAMGDSSAYAELIAAARSAIEVKDSVALSNAADQLQAANATAFAASVTALKNASEIAAKYEVNSWSR